MVQCIDNRLLRGEHRRGFPSAPSRRAVDAPSLVANRGCALCCEEHYPSKVAQKKHGICQDILLPFMLRTPLEPLIRIFLTRAILPS